WFRGSEWAEDALAVAWRDVANAAYYEQGAVTGGPKSPGASLYVPVKLTPGTSKTIKLQLAWYVPASDLREPRMLYKRGRYLELSPRELRARGTYKPWYAGALPEY